YDDARQGSGQAPAERRAADPDAERGGPVAMDAAPRGGVVAHEHAARARANRRVRACHGPHPSSPRDRGGGMTERWQLRLAALAGFAVVAAFVAGKAARDAMFLSTFEVTLLPTFAGISAVITIPLVLVVARRMSASGPTRVVPMIFGVSAA